jgi:hypothetical protein
MAMSFRNVFGSRHNETNAVPGSEKFNIVRKPGKKAAAVEAKSVEGVPVPDAAPSRAPSRKPRPVVGSNYMRRGEDEQDSEF